MHTRKLLRDKKERIWARNLWLCLLIHMNYLLLMNWASRLTVNSMWEYCINLLLTAYCPTDAEEHTLEIPQVVALFSPLQDNSLHILSSHGETLEHLCFMVQVAWYNPVLGAHQRYQWCLPTDTTDMPPDSLLISLICPLTAYWYRWYAPWQALICPACLIQKQLLIDNDTGHRARQNVATGHRARQN